MQIAMLEDLALLTLSGKTNNDNIREDVFWGNAESRH